MKLIESNRPVCINVLDLQDGQVAVIREHSSPVCIGAIVQRYKDSLVRLGKSSLHSWENIYNRGLLSAVQHRAALAGFNVECLADGATLVVETFPTR